MSYRHIYEPSALVEYKKAISWYQERNETAADNFVKEVKEKIIMICDDPSLPQYLQEVTGNIAN